MEYNFIGWYSTFEFLTDCKVPTDYFVVNLHMYSKWTELFVENLTIALLSPNPPFFFHRLL